MTYHDISEFIYIYTSFNIWFISFNWIPSIHLDAFVQSWTFWTSACLSGLRWILFVTIQNLPWECLQQPSHILEGTVTAVKTSAFWLLRWHELTFSDYRLCRWFEEGTEIERLDRKWEDSLVLRLVLSSHLHWALEERRAWHRQCRYPLSIRRCGVAGASLEQFGVGFCISLFAYRNLNRPSLQRPSLRWLSWWQGIFVAWKLRSQHSTSHNVCRVWTETKWTPQKRLLTHDCHDSSCWTCLIVNWIWASNLKHFSL